MAVVVEPILTEEKLRSLLVEKHEQSCLDYKRSLNLAGHATGRRDTVELAKDIAAMHSYGSCRSLPWRLVGVGVPSLVGLLGPVLVAASPQRPGVAVRPVAAGVGDDGAAELSQQLRHGDGDQFEHAGAAV